MLKQISLSSQLPLPDAPLIKAAWLRSATTATKLEQQARVQAQRILRDARTEADKIHSEAWIEGYVAGMERALDTVVSYINNIESTTSHLLTHSQQQLEKQLQQLFANESCVENMLALLAHHLGREKVTDHKAIVSFPAYAINTATKIRDSFQQCGIAVELRTSPLEELRVEYGQEIWCCDFHHHTSRLSQLALRSTFDEQGIPDKLQEYRRVALNALAEKLTTV